MKSICLLISVVGLLIVFVEQALMTLQFSGVFFLKAQFCFKCWEIPHRNQFHQIFDMCPFDPQALETLCVVSPRLLISFEQSFSVTRPWHWKNSLLAEPAILLLSSIASVVTPASHELVCSGFIPNSFRRFLLCFSFFDN